MPENNKLIIKNLLLIQLLWLVGLIGITPAAQAMTRQELLSQRASAALQLVIMSDNKGQADNIPTFARMHRHIKQAKPYAVIGLGDHLKKNWIAPFLDLLRRDPFWQTRFFPNIADGENGYYGKHQADWCKGGALLREINLHKHAQTLVRPNKCEYYSILRTSGYTIHLLQLHYPDEPANSNVAFTQDSRQWMSQVLQTIKREPRTFVIVAAHSRSGDFLQSLSPAHRQQVLAKADLLLSATTHYFQRLPTDDQPEVLSLNTGSPTYQSQRSFAGFVQLSFLTQPERVLVEYICTEDDWLLPPAAQGYVFIQARDQAVRPVTLDDLPRQLDFDKPIMVLKQAVSQAKLAQLLQAEISRRAKRKVDVMEIGLAQGLPAGPVTRADLETCVQYNNSVMVYGLKQNKKLKWHATDSYSYPAVAFKKPVQTPFVLDKMLVELLMETLKPYRL